MRRGSLLRGRPFGVRHFAANDGRSTTVSRNTRMPHVALQRGYRGLSPVGPSKSVAREALRERTSARPRRHDETHKSAWLCGIRVDVRQLAQRATCGWRWRETRRHPFDLRRRTCPAACASCVTDWVATSAHLCADSVAVGAPHVRAAPPRRPPRHGWGGLRARCADPGGHYRGASVARDCPWSRSSPTTHSRRLTT